MWLANHRGTTLRPFSVVPVSDGYAIRDGHHRVSVAKARAHDPGGRRSVSSRPVASRGVSDYVTVERADNEAMAELIQQRLDEADIPCRLVPSGMAAVAGAGTAFAVTVPAERADEARQLLGN